MEPIPAASVILLRDADEGVQVFMARRHIKSDFAPDVYVFPGGKAEPEDAVPGTHLVNFATPRLAGREAPPIGWAAIYMAAIRELFEEAGLLLAVRSDGTLLEQDSDGSVRDKYSHHREEVRAGRLSMRHLAKMEMLVYAADQLRLFSNWITPGILSKRFDTYFFVAGTPSGQVPVHADERELTDSLWITPSDALRRCEDGNFPLVFATERHLMALGRFQWVDEILAATNKPVHPICPRWVMEQGARRFLIPGDPGYESAES